MLLGRARTSALVACAASLVLLAPARPAQAQSEEARALFEQGNEHLARGLRTRGPRRTRELEAALDAYLGVLRVGARTRNVVFNLGLTNQELGRPNEAFNYYSEYLRVFDLSDDERAEGARRIEQVRAEVAVVEIRSTPEGAEVRFDRRDLPVRGTTPLTIALPPGEHAVFLDREGYLPAEATVTATVGASAAVERTLEGAPVPVQVIAPANGELTLDGAPIVAGRSTPVPPGAHVVRLVLPGSSPVERRFEVQAGDDPMVLELSASGPVGTPVSISVDAPAAVFLDGVRIGMGSQIDLPVPPGPHTLGAEATDRTPLSQALTVADEPLSLRVSLGERADNTGLDWGRLLPGTLALFAVIGTAITVTGALMHSEEWDRELAAHNSRRPEGYMSEAELNQLADRVEAWSLAADVTMIVGGVFAVTSVIFFAIPDAPDEPSRLEIGAAPTAGGGTLVARGRFGEGG